MKNFIIITHLIIIDFYNFIQVEWYKDGKKLSIGSFPHTNIIHVTDYSVTLAFESVQPDHRGKEV